MSRGDPIARAEAAARLLDDNTSKDAFATMREELVSSLEHIPLTTEQNRRAAIEMIRQLQTLSTFRSKLVALVERGKLEERRIEDAENRPQRAKDPRWITKD